MATECSVLDCPEPVRALGWCMAHYQRYRRHGDPEGWSPCVVPNCDQPRVDGRNWCEAHVREDETREELPWWHFEARGTLESDVVLELMDRLRDKGYLVRPEFYIPEPSLRADVAVWAYPGERPFLIEVKPDSETFLRYGIKSRRKGGRQDKKYAELGWPHFFCFGLEGIEPTLRAVDKWRNANRVVA